MVGQDQVGQDQVGQDQVGQEQYVAADSRSVGAGTNVVIFDTTLRDGEQAPGISLDTKEKLEIAEQLARLKVDVIEAGFPIASQGDFEAVRAVAEQVGTAPDAPAIAGLARCVPEDIERAGAAVEPATRGRVHVFLSTSDVHRQVMFPDASDDDLIKQGVDAVSRAREFTDDVEFSPQDATRTGADLLFRIVEETVAAGATTVNIPDTVGYAMPHDFGPLIGEIVRRVGDRAVVSVHCHNDLGLAVANSIEAVRYGATQVEVAVNGIGERAGNCSLEEVVMALATRADRLERPTRVVTREITRTSKLVSALTGYPIQFNKAVVGRNAFAHEAGIHQHGVMEDRLTYEIMRAEDVGANAAQIVLGKHSGRRAFSAQLSELGLELTREETDRAFARFKELADRKVELTDEDLRAIVADEVASAVTEKFELESLQVSGGTTTAPNAVVTVRRVDDDTVIEVSSSGDGMVDAACGAIRRAVDQLGHPGGTLMSFNVAAVTKGIDALGDVTVQVEVEGRSFTGRGVSTDIVEASARAYLHAINRSARLHRREAAAVTP